MSLLSGRMAGHKGSLTYVKHASDPQSEMSDHDIYEWRLNMRRQMRDITQVNQSVKEFWYSHADTTVDFKAYINSGETDPVTYYYPGSFNRLEPATVTLWPDGDRFNQKWVMSGWLEEMRVIISIGAPNTLIGRIRATGDVITTWPEP